MNQDLVNFLMNRLLNEPESSGKTTTKSSHPFQKIAPFEPDFYEKTLFPFIHTSKFSSDVLERIPQTRYRIDKKRFRFERCCFLTIQNIHTVKICVYDFIHDLPDNSIKII